MAWRTVDDAPLMTLVSAGDGLPVSMFVRTVLPSLVLISRGLVVQCSIGEALSLRVLSQLLPWHGQSVTSAHVGPILTDDDLRTTELVGRHVAVRPPPCEDRARRNLPTGLVGAMPSHRGRARQRVLPMGHFISSRAAPSGPRLTRASPLLVHVSLILLVLQH